MNKRKDSIIFLVIYLVALAITLNFALRNPITSDRGIEYTVYHFTVDTGRWVQPGQKDPLNATIGYLVNSSITVTYIPAQLQRLTHLNEVLLFKTWPCFFYALMPAFVYLLSRRYLSIKQSILCSMMILTNFYFMYYANIGRVGVALGFTAVMLWAILTGRWVIGSIASVLIVLSHYATAWIVLFLLCFGLGYVAIRNRIWHKTATVVLAVMILASGIWYFGIATSVGQISRQFVADAIHLKTAETPIDGIPQPSTDNTGAVVPPETDNFFNISNREELIQIAFGKNLGTMNTPQKVEFALSWFLVLSIAWGLLVVFWRKLLSPFHIALGIGSFGLLMITLALPHLSMYYGMERVWFTGLISLAACWVIGTKKLGFYAQCSILIIYGLATSGILHRLFGIMK